MQIAPAAAAGSGGATTFAGLTDTEFTGLATDNLAAFNSVSGDWENKTFSELNLIETPGGEAGGDLLYYNSGWQLRTIGTEGYVLKVVSGAPDWAAELGAPHALLDGSTHSDTVADAVTRGSLVYGNATPKWDELVIGANLSVLASDGTDLAWTALTTSHVQSGTFADARIAESSVTQHEAAIDHDALTNFVANEHLDWSQDQGGTVIDVGNIADLSFFNGTFVETFDALCSSDGATVTMTLEQTGTGDLTMMFSDGLTTLDCTPAATLVLTAGSDSSPTTNYIYIPQSTKVLTKSTTQWPSAEHIKVTFVLVPSAATVQSDGCYINQNWNDHRTGTDEQGHLSHLCESIRLTMGGTGWHSGVDGGAGGGEYLDVVGSAPSVVYFKSSAGVGYQMHVMAIPAVDTSVSDDVHVVNWSGDAYHSVTDLADIIADATGASLSNRYYNLVFWGSVNKTGEYAPIFCNLPTGSYSTQSNAESDVSGYDVTSIPRAFIHDSQVGFLICRVTCTQNPSGTWTLYATADLRGVPAGASSGAGVINGGATSFADNAFSLFNVSDATKVVDWDLSGITTGNTRTITPADADMTLLSTTQYTDLTDGGETALHIHDARYYTETESDANFQPLDATLTAIAGLTTADGELIKATGVDAFSMLTISAFGETLIDDADAAAAQATLGLVIGTNVQAYDADLTQIAGISPTTGDFLYWTGGTWTGLGVGNAGEMLRTVDGTNTTYGKDFVIVVWTFETIETGDERPWFANKSGRTMAFEDAYAVLKTQGSTATTITIEKCTQANIDGTQSWGSIFSTALTIDANEQSSNTAAAAHAFTGSLAVSDHLRLNITGIGTSAAGITITLVLRYTG